MFLTNETTRKHAPISRTISGEGDITLILNK